MSLRSQVLPRIRGSGEGVKKMPAYQEIHFVKPQFDAIALGQKHLVSGYKQKNN